MTAARVLIVVVLAVLIGGCALLGGAPAVKGLEIEIHGNETLSSRELEVAMAPTFEAFEKSKYPKSVVDDAAFELERYHRSQGFAFALVRYEFSPATEGKSARAEFQIEEGVRVELGNIRFQGNQAYSSKALRKLYESTAPGLFARRSEWYVESEVNARTSDVARYYRDRGYLDVVVSKPYVHFSEDKTSADVEVVVQEGTRYVLTTVSVTGDLPYGEKELETSYAAYVGEAYVPRVAYEIQGRIEEFYADRGHADVKVTRARQDLGIDGRVTLELAVEAGPIVKVKDVVVRGNAETKGRVIRSRLLLERGDTYSRSKERKSFSRLYAMGLFETVRMSLDKENTGEERDLDIEVVETPSLEVFLEPGWGSYERLRVTAGMRERNLFGTGKILEAEATVGQLDQHGSVSLIDPFVDLFGREVSADLSVFGRDRDEPSFHRRELGSGIRFTSRLSRRLEVTTGYQYRLSEISDVDVGAVLPPEETDDVDISSVGAGVTYDTRDIIFSPTSGSLSKLSTEIAAAPLGSQLDFVRVNATQSSFWPLSGDTTLGASVRTGWIAPIGETDSIPLQERYFNGGESTVRSFHEDELGPKGTNGDPLGGEAFTVFSVEVRKKLIGHLHAAAFWDVGNVVPDHSDYWKFDDLRQGIGLGIRYELPIGPIRLDGALNPDPSNDEDSGALHFSVGLAF